MAARGRTVLGWGLAGAAGVAALTQSFGHHPVAPTGGQHEARRTRDNGNAGATTVDNPFGDDVRASPSPTAPPDRAPPGDAQPAPHSAAADAGVSEGSEASPELPRAADVDDAQGGFTCERKTCGQMSSCDEARYHLSTCGDARLDRDHDGVPCESICR